MKNKFNKKKAFTLIEILLVLSIIGAIVTLGVSSYGLVRKKIRLDIAANTIESIIVEAREKTRSGLYESGGDINTASSLCFGFVVTEGKFIQKIQAPYDRLKEKNKKCLIEKIKLVGKTDYDEDLIVESINLFGSNAGDDYRILFAPPNAEVELERLPIHGEQPVLELVISYKNSEDKNDKRIVGLNLLTANAYIKKFIDE